MLLSDVSSSNYLNPCNLSNELDNTNENKFLLDDKHMIIRTQALVDMAHSLMPTSWIPVEKVRELVELAYRTVDLKYGMAEANDWAEGFIFPEDVWWSDFVELGKMEWSLTQLAEYKNNQLIHDRFSVPRLMALWDQDDPDFNHLLTLAEGVPVWLDPDFVRTLTPPPLSTAYKGVSAVINKLCFEQGKQGQAVILPLSVVQDPRLVGTSNISLSGKYGWVPKHGAKEGRPTNNYSFDDRKGGLINSESVKSAVKEFYGAIELAKLDDLMKMILRQVNLVEGNWEKISLWKMDLKGAFSLLNFKTSEVGLLSMMLTGDLVFISLVGNFGLSQYPFVFGIVSRVLLRAIRKEIAGELDIFVDDLMGVCASDVLADDMKVAKDVVERLLGSKAISSKKTVSGRLLDWIGWEVNLITHTVSIAQHNFYKTLHGFMNVRKSQKVSVRDVQRLASWASRYATICRFMKPFTHFLYLAIINRREMAALITVESTLWMAIQLWQIFLIATKLDPIRYARCIRTFAERGVPGLWLSYDASLEGLGFVVRTGEPQSITGDPGRVGVVLAVSFDTPYQLNGDAGYQNTMEFIAIVMGLFCIRNLLRQNVNVQLIGDNTSSLHWCDKERFRGGRSNAAAIAFILMGIQGGPSVVGTSHIKGEQNVQCDRLSRGIRPRSMGFAAEVCPRVSRDKQFITLIQLINPKIEHDNERSLTALWVALMELFAPL